MAVKYVPYYKEPIEGQALLDNFVRTKRILKYADNDKVKERIKRGLPLYEAEITEEVGSESNNLIIRGECVSACAYLREKDINVDLVYIDPPFASGADYAKTVYIRRNPKVAEVIKKIERTLEIEELKSFEEKMYGDIWSKEQYLNWIYENLIAIKSIMSENASIYVHLDYHIIHYVKVLMDEIFGEDNFINELVWCYRGMAVSEDHYTRRHDTILFYSKSAEYIFNWKDVTEEFTKSTLQKYKYTDEKGRKYRLHGRNINGSPIQNITDVDPKWLETNPELCRIDYLDEKAGVRARDWFQFDYLNIWSNERVDYITQKPEELLQKFIKASSNEGMVVADFFGGSGVTAKVANDLKRNFIHCDIGINSIETTRDRLKEAGASFKIMDIKDGVNLYRNPIQTMDKIKSLIPGLKSEDSVSEFWKGVINDSKFGIIPVYIPDLTNSTTKLLDTVFMNKIINQAIPELSDDIKKVIIYYIDIIDKKEILDFIKEYLRIDIEIELRDLKEILSETIVSDIINYHIGNDKIIIDSFISDRVIGKINEYNEKMSAQNKNNKYIEISEEGLELIEMISLDCTASNGVWHSDEEIKIDRLGYIIINGNKTKELWDGTVSYSRKPLRIKVRNICGDEIVLNIDE
ncbi:MAG: site-specific DNA-methyltransferase [Clostridia bacterium]|nr:site-specific DNA-methyltransferase [Clostridia bacterium]